MWEAGESQDIRSSTNTVKKRRRPDRQFYKSEKHSCGHLQGNVWVWGECCSGVSLEITPMPESLPTRMRRKINSEPERASSSEDAGEFKIKKSQGGYLPPHLRKKTSVKKLSVDTTPDSSKSLTPTDGKQSPSSSRSSASLPPNDSSATDRERPINLKTGEDIVRDNSGITPMYADQDNWNEPHEWRFVCNYFTAHDSSFAELQEHKETGRDNRYVKTFFAFKDKNKDSSRTHRSNIPALFRRFYRYAVDIDVGTNFVQNFSDLNGSLFLEFGFAPGGMSKLLLDHDSSIKGVGVTLQPPSGGNVYPDDFLHHPGFSVVEADVIQLANSDMEHIQDRLGTQQMELAIIGITIHQPFDEFDHLDHQLIYSQLYLSLLYLKEGGSLLIRHKMGLSLIHIHLLILFMELFDGEPVFHKPLTEFAIRKTYWVLWKGFNREKLKQSKVLENCSFLLSEILKGNRSGYDYNAETKEYYSPCLIPRSIEDIFEEHGEATLTLQHPMWVIQSEALKAYMDGKRDRPCWRGQRCNAFRRGRCTAAHCVTELIPGIHENILKVNERIKQESLRLAERLDTSEGDEKEEIVLEKPPPKPQSRWGRSKLNIRRSSNKARKDECAPSSTAPKIDAREERPQSHDARRSPCFRNSRRQGVERSRFSRTTSHQTQI